MELANFHNFRCGEVFCVSYASYDIRCCLCGNRVALADFSDHFGRKHLQTTSENSGTATPNLHRKQQVIVSDLSKQDGQEGRTCGKDTFDCSTMPDSDNDDPKKESDDPTECEEFVKDTSLQPTSEGTKVIQPEVENHIDKQGEEPWPASTSESDYDWDIESSGDEFVADQTRSRKKNIKPAKEELLPLGCDLCDRRYKTQVHLQYHLQYHHRRHPNPIHKCNDCGEVFPGKRNLYAHMQKHRGIECDICGKPFAQAGNMRFHRIRHTGIKPYKCDECNATFYTDREMKKHKLRHSGTLPHICEICGKLCRDRGFLTAHMRRHTGERPAKCGDCGKCFYSIHDLNVHAVCHSDVRQFVCDVCGSMFRLKKALRVHKKIHSSDRHHKCPICGKAYVQSSYLTAHIKTHDVEILKRRISENGGSDKDV